MTEEFEQGRRAGRSSRLPEETPNPHEEGTVEHERWEMGYDVGCEEFNENIKKKIGF